MSPDSNALIVCTKPTIGRQSHNMCDKNRPSTIFHQRTFIRTYIYKVINAVCVTVCPCPRISVRFACTRLTSCLLPSGPLPFVRRYIRNYYTGLVFCMWPNLPIVVVRRPFKKFVRTVGILGSQIKLAYVNNKTKTTKVPHLLDWEESQFVANTDI